MQENFTDSVKKTSYSRAFFTHATLPTDLNEGGTVYGARLLEWADNLAGVVAIKHRRGSVTTASFDSFDFLNPIRLGDFIFGEAYISGVGAKSMEIFVKFIGENSVTGDRYLAAMAFITYAALDLKDGETLPKIEGETEDEIRFIADYEKRRAKIKERRERNKDLESRIDLYAI
ncbi:MULTISPECIES: acyl-CoA thioesterase [Peptoniphilus]|uniref:acyl-CoA thioesterase n=1 Tax=Peptoniphilus TaxID=162289 RepID=UPI0001DAA438|nr:MULTISPECIES: acyl-CoA thioesterase [Peptoniphilus]EFI41350.1 thioesterase family protein [Peptoniphilus sp. oral taxon 386 str. F0131]